jgi:hypothetical protein
MDLQIDFFCKKIKTEKSEEIDYSRSYFSLVDREAKDTQDEGIEFHVFSDLISPATGNYDVLTFYLTFVIVIGNAIRGIISGEAEKIILTEMPEPSKLINLCEGIKISRYRQHLDREEYLYYVLIDFMRSPEILKKLTKSSLQKLRERKEDEDMIDSKVKKFNKLKSE